MSALSFFIGMTVGSIGGVLLMCLMFMARTSDDDGHECCTHDCNQGRSCVKG